MTDPCADRAFMRGYALTSSYLRGRFQVPKVGMPADWVSVDRTDRPEIAVVSLLPPPLPPTSAMTDPADFPALLATLFAYSIGYLRWEPRNPSRLYAAIPRPGGGAFSTRLRLGLPDGRGMRSHWAYDPESHSLQPLGETACDHPMVRIGVVCDLGRIVKGYGDFALTLAMLEGGHSQAQLSMLLRAMEVDAAWFPGPVDGPGRDPRGGIGIGRFDFACPGAADAVQALPRATARMDVPVPADSYGGKFPVMIRAAEAIARADVARSDIARSGVAQPAARAVATPTTPPAGFDIDRLLRASRRRTSGLQGEGFVPRPAVDVAGLRSVLADWTVLSRHLHVDPRDPVRCHLAVTGVRGMEPQLAEYDLRAGSLRAGVPGRVGDVLRRNIGLGAGYNFDQFAFTLLMTCPMLRRIERDGPAAYRAVLVEAGALGQAFLMAISDRGMFGRPFRAYTEAALEQKFGIDDQIVYVILCGADRIANPVFAMLDAPPDGRSAAAGAAVDARAPLGR